MKKYCSKLFVKLYGKSVEISTMGDGEASNTQLRIGVNAVQYENERARDNNEI